MCEKSILSKFGLNYISFFSYLPDLPDLGVDVTQDGGETTVPQDRSVEEPAVLLEDVEAPAPHQEDLEAPAEEALLDDGVEEEDNLTDMNIEEEKAFIALDPDTEVAAIDVEGGAAVEDGGPAPPLEPVPANAG